MRKSLKLALDIVVCAVMRLVFFVCAVVVFVPLSIGAGLWFSARHLAVELSWALWAPGRLLAAIDVDIAYKVFRLTRLPFHQRNLERFWREIEESQTREVKP